MRIVAILAVLLIFWTSSLALSTPSAEASCNPGRSSSWQNYHAGWGRAVSGIKGVKATQLEEYDPYVYSYSTSTAYVMLETTNRWAQIGWVKNSYERTVYAQWYNGGADINTRYYHASAPVGSYNKYEVLYLTLPRFPGQFASWTIMPHPQRL